MKRSALLTTLLTAAALTAVPASAQNLSGMWELTQETGRGTRTQTLTIVVDGTTLTGTVTRTGGGRRGGGGGGGPQTNDISDGSVDGNTFTFTITRTFGDNSFSQVYTGTIEGETLTGTIAGGGRRGGGQPQPFTAKRPS